MRQRCNYKRSAKYPKYGGSGVTHAPEWATFVGFFASAGRRPPGTTLDRIDPAGDYTPENCRWATPTQQARNTRGNVVNEAKARQIRLLVTMDYGLTEVGRMFGVTPQIVYQIKKGTIWKPQQLRPLTSPN